MAFFSGRQNEQKHFRGVVKIDPDDLPLEARDLVTEVQEVFSSPSYRPPLLPRQATEVLAMSRDPTASLEKIVKVLETDPMLVGKVVARVNSAALARNRPVRSLRDALSRLGIAGLRDVVVEAALTMRVFRAAGFQEPMERLRLHSVKVAEIMRRVCHHTLIDAEHAFLAGLLHDIGVAGILIALTERTPKRKLDPASLWPAVDSTHAAVSETMARLWSFPPELVLVLGHHHQPKIDGQAHPMCAALIVADDMAQRLGIGIDPKMDRTRPDRLAAAKEILSYTSKTEGLVEKDLEDEKGCRAAG